jgi:hypothetical protein
MKRRESIGLGFCLQMDGQDVRDRRFDPFSSGDSTARKAYRSQGSEE